jgi:CO/xanthine dehydrogenase FAD-binding subunit
VRVTSPGLPAPLQGEGWARGAPAGCRSVALPHRFSIIVTCRRHKPVSREEAGVTHPAYCAEASLDCNGEPTDLKAIDYACPTTLDEVVGLLSTAEGAAGILAGGTDVIVQVREGRRDVDLLIDVKKIPDLNELSYDAKNGAVIGAAVPCCELCEHEAIAAAYPGLIDAASLIGGTAIQSRASFGGNLCNASPAADSIPALMVHSAVCTVAGRKGRREVPVEQFCTAPGKTVLERSELLVSFHVPAPPKRAGAHYLRFIPRNEMDIAVVGAGALVVLDESGTSFVSGRVALGAVAPTPLLVEDAGELLQSAPVSDETIGRVAHAAQAAARPISDMRGTAEQRRHLVGVLTRRALHKAVQRAIQPN